MELVTSQVKVESLSPVEEADFDFGFDEVSQVSKRPGQLAGSFS